jgi:sugar O-acyltransferase (sialic acid O-acetyltransferase NeuD family)
MIELVLIGGGGHARACIDLIQASDQFQILGILDRSELVGTEVLGIPVIGTDEDLPVLVKKNLSFLITLGQIKTPDLRIRIYKRIKVLGGLLSTVIATSAHVSPFAQIGEGSIIMGKAMIGPGVRIGENCIINTNALVEHDSVVGKHCHISTGAIINGGCQVGDGVFVGSRAVLRQDIRIGDRKIISMGAAIFGDVE